MRLPYAVWVLGVVWGAVAGCGGDGDGNPVNPTYLRIVHASADAPTINGVLDGKSVVEALDFAGSSGFTTLEAGAYDFVVEGIVPGGNVALVADPTFELEAGIHTTVVALGDLDAMEPLVIEEPLATHFNGRVALRAVHAASSRGGLDVYVTNPGEGLDPLEPDVRLDFKEEIDAGLIPAAVREVQVTATGSKEVVYRSGGIDFADWDGSRLIVLLVNTVTEVTRSASPIQLVVVSDSSAVPFVDTNTRAGGRFVHASTNATVMAGGPLEVFAAPSAGGGAQEVVDSFGFAEIQPDPVDPQQYGLLDPDSYVFDVAPDGSGMAGSFYTSGAFPLPLGSETTVLAAGRVGGAPAFSLIATEDDNRSVGTQVSIKLVNALSQTSPISAYVTPAGDVSVAEIEGGLAGPPTVSSLSFGAVSESVAVLPGDVDIRVVNVDLSQVIINAESFPTEAGEVMTAVARGRIEPAGDPATLGLLVLYATSRPPE